MSTLRAARINARTVVLDAPQNDASPPPLHVLTGRCMNPTCPNPVKEAWEDTGRYCARCAIEADLYDRETRRERCFPGEPF